MATLCYSASLLLSIPFGSLTHPAPPDSSAVSARRHLLTAHTLHIASPFIPALGYEVVVRPRWGVRASLGGAHNTYRYNSSYVDANGMLTSGTREYRSTDVLLDASFNYYLQSQKPALMGWFVGAGIITGFSHFRVTDDDPAYRSYSRRHVAARPFLRAGRHWALGQRWLLDTHVGVAVWTDPNRLVFLKEFIGVGAGYRF
jgi:hypothetical protein